MAIKKIKVNNFTVFNELEINASDGVNVIIGENGVGKTHLLKLIYSVWLARNEILTNANKIFARKEKYRFIYQDNSNKQGNIIRELIYETIWEGFNQTYLKWAAPTTQGDRSLESEVRIQNPLGVGI